MMSISSIQIRKYVASLSVLHTIHRKTFEIFFFYHFVDPANILHNLAQPSVSKTQAVRRAPDVFGDRVLLKNAYVVEFEPNSNAETEWHTVCYSLQGYWGIESSEMKKRLVIDTPLFTGISFTINVDHPIDVLDDIPNAIAFYPIYLIPAPEPVPISSSPLEVLANSFLNINSYNLTGVNQVHNQLNNFGNGVRVRNH